MRTPPSWFWLGGEENVVPKPPGETVKQVCQFQSGVRQDQGRAGSTRANGSSVSILSATHPPGTQPQRPLEKQPPDPV